jgi:hypothetical protein
VNGGHFLYFYFDGREYSLKREKIMPKAHTKADSSYAKRDDPKSSPAGPPQGTFL